MVELVLVGVSLMVELVLVGVSWRFWSASREDRSSRVPHVVATPGGRS